MRNEHLLMAKPHLEVSTTMNLSAHLMAVQEYYDKVAVFYDQFIHGDNWNALRRSQHNPWYASALEGNANNALALDCGCGTGFHMAWIRQRGFEVHGLDISNAMLQQAAKNLKLTSSDKKKYLQSGNISDLPAAIVNSKFDLLICLGSTLLHLESYDDLKSAMSGFSSALRPGGLCIIEVDDMSSIPISGEEAIELVHFEKPSSNRRDSPVGIDFWTLTENHLISNLIIFQPDRRLKFHQYLRLRLSRFSHDQILTTALGNGFRVVHDSLVTESELGLYGTLFDIQHGSQFMKSTRHIIAEKA